MGPKKGKKKGKKSGEGGEKKKKEPPGETVTFKEAVMTYQLEVKQRQFNSLKEDIEELKAKNERQKQRNGYLQREQNRHIKDVIVQAQENEVVLSNCEQVPYEDVEKALQEKLSTIRIEEGSVEDKKENIEKLDEEVVVLSRQLQQLHEYKDNGLSVDKTHITVLLKEMADMDTSYAEMANFFDKSLATMKQTITKQNQENIAVQKNFASEVVIKNLHKHTEQEFLDNEWLNKEVSIHRNHISGVEVEVETLEKQNIEVMSYLFEQQVDDMKETKKFQLACTQEEAKEDLLLLCDGEDGDGNDDDDDIVEDTCEDVIEVDGVVGEDVIEVDGVVGEEDEIPDDLKWLEQYLYEFDATATQDDYKLGPVEVKLLCVVGNKMPLHDISEMATVDGFSTASKSDVHYDWIVEKEELQQYASMDGLHA